MGQESCSCITPVQFGIMRPRWAFVFVLVSVSWVFFTFVDLAHVRRLMVAHSFYNVNTRQGAHHTVVFQPLQVLGNPPHA